MLQLCGVVIFDNFGVFVSRLLVVFHTDFLLCNKSDRYIYIVGFLYGAGCPVSGYFFRREPLCVEVPVTLPWNGHLFFGARLCWGGG